MSVSGWAFAFHPVDGKVHLTIPNRGHTEDDVPLEAAQQAWTQAVLAGAAGAEQFWPTAWELDADAQMDICLCLLGGVGRDGEILPEWIRIEGWTFSFARADRDPDILMLTVPDRGGMSDAVPAEGVQQAWTERALTSREGVRQVWPTAWEIQRARVGNIARLLLRAPGR